jgi:hypothetical protein
MFAFLTRGYWSRVWKNPTLEDEVRDSAEQLERTVLTKELERIDIEEKIAAARRKREYLAEWLTRDLPKPVGGLKMGLSLSEMSRAMGGHG